MSVSASSVKFPTTAAEGLAKYSDEKKGESRALMVQRILQNSGNTAEVNISILSSKILKHLESFNSTDIIELFKSIKNLYSKNGILQPIPYEVRTEISKIFANYCVSKKLIDLNIDGLIADAEQIFTMFGLIEKRRQWFHIICDAFYETLTAEELPSSEFYRGIEVLYKTFSPKNLFADPSIMLETYLYLMSKLKKKEYKIGLIDQITKKVDLIDPIRRFERVLPFSSDNVQTAITFIDKSQLPLSKIMNFYYYLNTNFKICQNKRFDGLVLDSILDAIKKDPSLSYRSFCYALIFLVNEVPDLLVNEKLQSIKESFRLNIVEDGWEGDNYVKKEYIQVLFKFFIEAIIPYAKASAKPIRDLVFLNLAQCVKKQLLIAVGKISTEEITDLARSFPALPRKTTSHAEIKRNVIQLLFHSVKYLVKARYELIKDREIAQDDIDETYARMHLERFWEAVSDLFRIGEGWYPFFLDLFCCIPQQDVKNDKVPPAQLDLALDLYAATCSPLKLPNQLVLKTANGLVPSFERNKKSPRSREAVRLAKFYLMFNPEGYLYTEEEKNQLADILNAKAIDLDDTMDLYELTQFYDHLGVNFYPRILDSLLEKFEKATKVKYSQLYSLLSLITKPEHKPFLDKNIHKILAVLNLPFIFDDFDLLFPAAPQISTKDKKAVGNHYTRMLDTLAEEILVHPKVEANTAKYLRTRLALHWLNAARERFLFYRSFLFTKIAAKIDSDYNDLEHLTEWRRCVNRFSNFATRHLKSDVFCLISHATEKFDSSRIGLVPSDQSEFQFDFRDLVSAQEEKRDLLYRLQELVFDRSDVLEPRCVMTPKHLALEWYTLKNDRIAVEDRIILIDYDKSPRSNPGSPLNSPRSRSGSRGESPKRSRQDEKLA